MLLILSSHHPVTRLGEGIIDGSVLSLREMAELTKHCTLLIDAAADFYGVDIYLGKSLPMIQMLNKPVCYVCFSSSRLSLFRPAYLTRHRDVLMQTSKDCELF